VRSHSTTKQTHTGDAHVQRPKNAPAATRTPTTVAPIPVTPRAPLLPPLKEPVDVGVGEVPVDEPDPLEMVDVLLMVEPTPEVDVREGRIEVPFPDVDEVDDKEEDEDSASAISNAAVRESVVVTSPIGEAWKVYPGPAGTTGRTTSMVPSAVVTTFFKAKVLRKASLVR
jgi:hypothetical protein